MFGSRAPEPRTSQALSAAAATIGVPAARPRWAAAAEVRSPSRSVGGTSSGSRPGSTGMARHFQSRPGGPAEGLVVERHVADLGRGRVHEAPGEAVAEEARQVEEVGRPPPDVGLVCADPVRLRVGLEGGDRVADAEGPEREAGDPADGGHGARPALVEPDHGRPEHAIGLVEADDRAPLGRQRDGRDRIGGSAGHRPERPAGVAERAPVELGILLGPAGLRRDVRLDRDLGPREELAAGVEEQGTHALGADVEGQQPVGGSGAWAGHRAVLLVLGAGARRGARVVAATRAAGAPASAVSAPASASSAPGFRIPFGSKVAGQTFQGGHAGCPLLGGQVRGVVAPHAVLVADRAAAGHDRLGCRRLEARPALQRPVGVLGQAEDVRRVQARARRVDVRQVGERVHPLALGRQALAQAGRDGRQESRHGRPGRRRLERVDRVARVPQGVAEVRATGSAGRPRHGRTTAAGRCRDAAPTIVAISLRAAPTRRRRPVTARMSRQRSGPAPRQRR